MSRSADRATRDVPGVRDYIDRHYARPLTIERLAALAGLSPFHFIRAFRAASGLTPHQYLRNRRIERAKELLVTTPMPVTEVCDAVGFQSLGSFSSLFRKLTGKHPRATGRSGVAHPPSRGATSACIERISSFGEAAHATSRYAAR